MSSIYFQKWRETTIAYLGGVCVVCGSTEDLEIDHIDESQKEFSVSTYWGTSDKESLQREIDKCQLLCYTHHLEKSIEYRRKIAPPYKHGTMYSCYKRKCVCEICEAAKKVFGERKNAKRSKNKRAKTHLLSDEEIAHGTVIRYGRGCRCDECRGANALKERARRAVAKAALILEKEGQGGPCIEGES